MINTPDRLVDDRWLNSAIDLHVHSGQDWVDRLLTDEEAVRDALDAGMRGVLIKSHMRPTLDSCLEIERRLDLDNFVFPSLVLNSQELIEDVDDVRDQIRRGVCMLYMPTVLAQNPQNPLNRDRQRISITEDNGQLRPSLMSILETAAEYRCAVATGHCEFQECMELLSVCSDLGVPAVLVTHPEYFVTKMSLEQQREIVNRWPMVMFERTLYSVIDESLARSHPGQLHICPDRLRQLADNINQLGSESTVLSSDLGQTFLPRPVHGFAQFMTALADEGIAKSDIEIMTKVNPLRCLGQYDEMLKEALRIAFEKHSYEFQTPFREPLIGWAPADDPLFGDLTGYVNQNHLIPSQLLAGAASVVSIFLPFGRELVEGNAPGLQPTPEWCLAYTEANALLGHLTNALDRVIRQLGYDCAQSFGSHHLTNCHDPDVAPELLSSTWSQRHVAYVCGLGTFGRNNLLITDNGCAGRLSSLVTDMPLLPRQHSRTERCLAKAGHKCEVCISLCPSKALGAGKFDRVRCWKYLVENNHVSRDSDHPIVNVCGKCASSVPCAMASPISR